MPGPCSACLLHITPSSSDARPYDGHISDDHATRKAGVVMYDPDARKVLLVRSYTGLWGPPKGSVKQREQFINGAVRELHEETGIVMSVDTLFRQHVRTICIYECLLYIIAVDSTRYTPYINTDLEYNDVDANGWYCYDCAVHLPLNTYGKRILRLLSDDDGQLDADSF